jgi:SAM-dependent methyltransferase
VVTRPDWSRRATEAELMDDAALPAQRLAAVLRDLAQVNGVTRAAPPTLRWLAQATRRGDRFTLLDVGAGHGDMLRRIARWARRTGRHATLAGVDQNPHAAAIARGATDPALGITWHTGEAAAVVAAAPAPPEFIISSLVAHHMGNDELVAFLRWMEHTARRGWFVNDLHRHPVAWHGYRLLAAAMRWDPIVRHDGALSVRRAFVRGDWDRLLQAAGVPRAAVTVRWHLPFRLCVGRRR